ncbi:hypothetical protein CDAR_398511 [Caerostris darwini]|uniref:Uncharacterized protein n=1 Tax=Caerostris darwini TaxID=1538125 RepID=A0AAV4VG28_9ARAC|nr:hypothetical protein CDAR_398511 [Caerostris darwini]
MNPTFVRRKDEDRDWCGDDVVDTMNKSLCEGMSHFGARKRNTHKYGTHFNHTKRYNPKMEKGRVGSPSPDAGSLHFCNTKKDGCSRLWLFAPMKIVMSRHSSSLPTHSWAGTSLPRF